LIPLFDELPTRKLPLVTLTLIFMNIVVFIFTMGLLISGTEKANRFVYRYSMVPWEITHHKHVSISDLEDPMDSPDPEAPDRDPYGKNVYLALLTHMFLHGGVFHVLGNMWFLWVFGGNVEEVYGGLPFLLFYLFCGLCAALAQWATSTEEVVIMLGASGAISGVMGAYLVLYPRQKIFSVIFFWPVWIPAWGLMLAYLGYQLLFVLIYQVSMQSGGGGGGGPPRAGGRGGPAPPPRSA
jgi:membrane associated rhomboid family serine protease